MDGVREAPAEFRRDPLAGSARFRRFGDGGPVYQVLETVGDEVLIELLENDERATLPLADVLACPIA